MIYYASFVSGMQEIISTVLKERLPGISISRLLDGAVIFETDCTYDRLNFLCFNNIFAVIDIFESEVPAEIHIKKILSGKGGVLPERAINIISNNNKKIRTFRLVCSAENKPVSVNENSKREIETFISGLSGLKVNRAKPDTEFWFLYRREGFSSFMKRLTNNTGDTEGRRGELSPQLAWLLCKTADLKHGETAADPFCGYGSIPEAGCKHFHIKKFYASDIDSTCVKITKEKHGLKNERAEIHEADISSVFDFIQEGEIDAIVTDPPWGMYKETALPVQAFYDKMTVVFSKLLKSGGRALVLSAAGKELEEAAEKTNAFTLERIIPILVSGKKASVYLFRESGLIPRQTFGLRAAERTAPVENKLRKKEFGIKPDGTINFLSNEPPFQNAHR